MGSFSSPPFLFRGGVGGQFLFSFFLVKGRGRWAVSLLLLSGLGEG